MLGEALEHPETGRRPTIVDVARHAGVSTATVDRVLNGRQGVRAPTVQRVMKSAAELGYVEEGALSAATPQTLANISFLLPAGTNRYLVHLGRSIIEHTSLFQKHGIKPTVEYIKSFSPEALATALQKHGRSAEGIAFMALEHPAVREAVNKLAARGVPTVTLISDIANAQRSAYLGLDNRSTGRLAGYLIARFVGKAPAKVAMIAGSLSYRAHEEREMGFLHVLKESYPHIEVVGIREGHDDETMNYRQMRMLLSQHPDLAGIYNIGGGASGVGKAIKDARREHSLVFVGHGLTPDTRAFLIEGTMDAVITQNPNDTIARAARVFKNLRDGLPADEDVEPLRSEVIFRENLP
ncbi:LacI family DNA-binding transcriptional regulator [Neorhizobium sp. CSC1952]|uniref:LacI family DNA-binding transcriptional regulator n=1 Tax=Neorhizobium sp. CSC1952 TaxID=2978974 RepID=UPI0025A62929|nr:LacI family DNA-binding transcriptional regulator [Rhizobium sp. CSC1952]WJR65160.1 LacI family DNA-binding transcriptional regulator [Rhizobium sp. CSC1952]